MYNVHLDNPQKIESWLERLTPEERVIFDEGYLTALSGVVEQIQDSKIKILGALHDLADQDDSTKHIKKRKLELGSRIKLLDIYDEHFTKRIENLASKAQSHELLPSSE